MLASPAVILASWAVIGFRGITEYPAILRQAGRAFGEDGPFVQGLAKQLGLGNSGAMLVAITVAGVLFVMATRVGEVQSLALACLACLALSPVAWVFYAAILIVPFAAAGLPTRSWLVLLGFWVSWWYSPLPYTTAWLSLATLGVAVTMVWLTGRGASSESVAAGVRAAPAA